MHVFWSVPIKVKVLSGGKLSIPKGESDSFVIFLRLLMVESRIQN